MHQKTKTECPDRFLREPKSNALALAFELACDSIFDCDDAELVTWTFAREAAELAEAVVNADHHWSDFTGELSRAGAECGIDPDIVQRSLAEAWRWAQRCPSHWTQLVGDWIYVAPLRAFYHLPTRAYLSELSYCVHFQGLSPDQEEPITSFLFKHGMMETVLRVDHGAGGDRGFYEAEEGLCFNEP